MPSVAAPNEVVRSVAKKLKYYFELKRREDGFDLSDVHQPQLDHPPLKSRPALQYDGLHDRSLKHYFTQPEVKQQITHMHGPTPGSRQPRGRREVTVKKMLDNYMTHYSFQHEYNTAVQRKRPASPKKSPPSCYFYHEPKQCSRPQSSVVLKRRSKKPKNLLGGWPTLRSVPDQHISRGEAARLVNSATKILVASNVNIGIRRPATAKETSTRKKRVQSAKPKSYPYNEETYTEKPRPRPVSAAQLRNRSPTPSNSTVSTVSTEPSVPAPRPASAKYRSRTIINAPGPRAREEVAVIRATQTAGDFDVGEKHDRQLLEKFDKLEEEVTEGPWCEYQVYVCTGTRMGSSTQASIKLTLFGEKGRTKEFVLKDSMRHKIPFQKGKEDLFILPAHHIGRVRKIQIGHDRPELSFAWYLEGVTVYDMTARRIFQFPCERWLSGQDSDKRTYRLIQVDREREFIDALADGAPMTKDKGRNAKHIYTSDAETSEDTAPNTSALTKQDNYSTKVRPSGDSSDSSDLSSDTDSEPERVPVNEHGSTPRQARGKKAPKDDYEEKTAAGTTITFNNTEAQTVDKVYMDPKAKAASYLEGYKSGVTASEEESKVRLQKEREMERALLQGKSIHDAVRTDDLERVKDLLHHFPEMRDFKDESSWTALHLAAARGNLDILKWLLTSEADIQAETTTGYTAMHIAAMNGHVNAMMLLQAMGSSIFGLTTENQSPLHLSAKSGHVECVKWLVANRASLTSQDASGRTALQLAEDFHRPGSADFLRVCVREMANPRSTFAMIQGRRVSQSGLAPIEEDAGSNTDNNQWTDDVKGHAASSGSSSEEDTPRPVKTKAEERELEQKKQIYKEQQERQESQGMSFLDSIRQDY